ncbi:peptide chain release factor N(5)-glutamine methyltransferase [Aquimarina hainanensis]|uniref:Release factor glutamine methyltransferase n=1 Tax=Aquimarina hainanensis TaxID=1578017 RepID=A0ABW5NFG9_9FLAO
MILKEAKAYFLTSLSEQYGREETLSFFYLITDHLLGMSRVQVALELQKKLTIPQKTMFTAAVSQLEKEVPVQYIIGSTNFYGLDFQVSEQVLIPRPETEELVHWIIEDCKNRKKEKKIRILDVGTGSGCIAITLAKHIPNATVEAIDVSEGAIEVAQKNAKQHGVAIRFINQDILTVASLDQRYDIIVSNPPYVREMEKKEMKGNVLKYEPHTALFVSDNRALVFYEKIAALATQSLEESGNLYFEINQYLGQEMKDMILGKGFDVVELRKDFFGNERMIKAFRK